MGIAERFPWVSVCPQCDRTEEVYLYDRGAKFFLRFLMANNRFACARCNITWRRKSPFHTHHLHSRDKREQTRIFIKQ